MNRFASSIVKRYENCSTFKVLNDNEDYYKNDEKDYSNIMLINTPPSNANKQNDLANLGNSTHNGIGLFTCTPN